MAVTISSVFDEVTQDVVVDAKLAKKIHQYQVGFVNSNPDHVAFFGGNLMGVHPMRFRTSDRENWFNEVLDIDEMALVDGIAQVTSIDAEWKRANDVMNLSCVWLLHAIQKSTRLSHSQKEKACLDVLLVLQYKFLGSLMAWYYRYPADEAVMLEAYARLSRKYALKVAGSWSRLLEQRAKEILSPRSIHHKTFMQFQRDKDIIYMVTDIQGRLREIVKSMTAVFYQVRDEGARIMSEKSMETNLDGEVALKDKSRNYTTLLRYTKAVIDDKASFVRPELTRVITDAMHTMPPKQFTEVLEWMSVNHRGKEAERIDKLVDETLIYAFNLIDKNRGLMSKTTGITPLLTKLRSLYMASRMSDSTLLLTKTLSEEIVQAAVKTRNSSVIASLRTAVQMYIVLRALAMNYYQK